MGFLFFIFIFSIYLFIYFLGKWVEVGYGGNLNYDHGRSQTYTMQCIQKVASSLSQWKYFSNILLLLRWVYFYSTSFRACTPTSVVGGRHRNDIASPIFCQPWNCIGVHLGKRKFSRSCFFLFLFFLRFHFLFEREHK